MRLPVLGELKAGRSTTASTNCAAVACHSSKQPLRPVHRTGFWRMSGHPAVQAALRNHYFDSLGLPRLYVPVTAYGRRSAQSASGRLGAFAQDVVAGRLTCSLERGKGYLACAWARILRGTEWLLDRATADVGLVEQDPGAAPHSDCPVAELESALGSASRLSTTHAGRLSGENGSDVSETPLAHLGPESIRPQLI
jgi:hypothetical protein